MRSFKIIITYMALLLMAVPAMAQNYYADDATFKSALQIETQLNARYNFITDYAGVNDGVTNNFTQFQNACTGSAGAKLYIPAGSYSITVPALTSICTVPANTVFEGAGKGVTFINMIVSDSVYTNIFTLANNGVTFRNLTINLISTSTVKTSLFGLQASRVKFENCAFMGDSVEGVRVGGTATNLDTVNIIFASSALTGTPITITYTVTTGQTTAQIAQGLVNAVNANVVLTAAGVTATLDGSFVKVNQSDTLTPQASYTTSVTGSATETLTVGSSSELYLVVISGVEADDFSMLYDDVSGFHYVILKSNIMTTINRRFTFIGGYYNKNITGALNINSPSGTFDTLLIEGVQVGSVGINNVNNLPIALAHVTGARIVNNRLSGTYQNGLHFEEGSNNLVVSGNSILMTTPTATGTNGYLGTCMYFMDNNIGGTYRANNDVTIVGNDCVGSTTNVSGNGIWVATTSVAHLRWTVMSNVFSGFFNGLNAGSINGLSYIGNTLTNYSASGIGLNIAAGTNYAVISGNTIKTYTTPISSAATLSRIEANYGYNPVGVTASATVGASPATICAGSSPESHYFVQAATFSATIALGGNTVGTTTSATAPVAVNLGPNECEVVTWVTTAPTYVKSVH